MKHIIFAFVTTTASLAQPLLITGFGTGEFEFLGDASIIGTSNQTTDSFSFTGTGSSSVVGLISPSFPNAGTFSQLELNATIVTYTAPATTFFIDLYDIDFDFITFQGNFAGYTLNLPASYLVSANSVNLGGGGSFDGNAVAVTFRLASIDGSVNLTLNSLSAVPEPASFAACAGAAVLGFVAVRRRKRAV